ncbi:MAG TPA: hypothetical protein VI564_09335 [Candidatus Nanoarchaeia archaeon]|nr:hypothetical protein [Candidatus Nanoarchaeia archaeon]
MIQELQRNFHSITKSLEILYVLEKTKPCARIMVLESEVEKTGRFLDSNNLKYSVSEFKVLKQNLQSDFYSDKSIKIEKSEPRPGYFFLYISNDGKICADAKKAEEENDHKRLGIILGYPKCCCDFFEKNFSEKTTDLTLAALKNSEGFEFPFYTNIAARHFDINLLSHFPHSFQCPDSINMAKSNLKIIEKHSLDIAKLFCSILQSAVIYTLEEGVFLLRKYEKADNKLIYGDVVSLTKSKLYFLVSSNKELTINSSSDFIINEVNIKGEYYGIMIFS